MWLTVKSEKPENLPVQQTQGRDTHLSMCPQDMVLSSWHHNFCVRCTFKSKMPTSLQRSPWSPSVSLYSLRSHTLCCFTLSRSCRSQQHCTVCTNSSIVNIYHILPDIYYIIMHLVFIIVTMQSFCQKTLPVCVCTLRLQAIHMSNLLQFNLLHKILNSLQRRRNKVVWKQCITYYLLLFFYFPVNVICLIVFPTLK